MAGRQPAGHTPRQPSSRGALQLASRGFGTALDLLFPPVCVACGADLPGQAGGILICGKCHDHLNEPAQLCRRCARPLPPGVSPEATGCPSCGRKPLRFDRAIALGVYGGPLRELVLRMKQALNEPLTVAMGQLLADRHRRNLPAPDLVAAVPMHWLRRLGRGVNCAETLAEVVASGIRVPAATDLLRCRRKTMKQGTLLPTERISNVRGAYLVSKGYDIRGAHLLVVDDVMTSGATANELARVLRRAGARAVDVAVIARGIGFG